MPFGATRIIPILTSHEIRRDFPDLIAEAEAALPSAVVTPAWRILPETDLDLLWAPPAEPPNRTFVARLRELGGDFEGIVLIARSALQEVIRELPSDDPCARNLRRLFAGDALRVRRHLLIGFDDGVRPCIGLVGFRNELLPRIDQLRRLADHTVPVLITGETGTGKEVIARALHRLGRRGGRKWLAINCAELPPGILESELFGHARGAFTGAGSDHAGLFEAAADGTAFLDEIGELPLAAQAKFLRVLEEHRVRRVGSTQARSLECRIVAATNRDLPKEIERGRFRADLFYRLRGAEISLAALRDRPRDVLLLADAFLWRATFRFRRPKIGVTEEARTALVAHSWPGNVRELRQVIESAVLAADDRWIHARDLSIVRQESLAEPPVPLMTVQALERAHILRALATTFGNKGAAAKLLGLTRQSLQRRLDRHRISPQTESGRSGPDPAFETGGRGARLPKNSRHSS